MALKLEGAAAIAVGKAMELFDSIWVYVEAERGPAVDPMMYQVDPVGARSFHDSRFRYVSALAIVATIILADEWSANRAESASRSDR